MVKHQILSLKPYGKPSDSYGKKLEIFMQKDHHVNLEIGILIKSKRAE